MAAAKFGGDPSAWQPGRRIADLGRAAAAHVARVRYGYGALEVAAALGYRSHGGVVAALQRYEAGRQRLARIARRVERDLTND